MELSLTIFRRILVGHGNLNGFPSKNRRALHQFTCIHNARLSGAGPDNAHHILFCLLFRLNGGIGLWHLTAEQNTGGIHVVNRGTTLQVGANRHSGCMHRNRYRFRRILQESQRSNYRNQDRNHDRHQFFYLNECEVN